MKIYVTGALGFIGSHFVDIMIEKGHQVHWDDAEVHGHNHRNRNTKAIRDTISDNIDWLVAFGAVSSVDKCNNLPVLAWQYNANIPTRLFHLMEGRAKILYVSTDEVYGPRLGEPATEEAPFRPSSPYSASKASTDMMCQAFFKTYGWDIRIVRPTNNYGPRQHPEKIIPTVVNKILSDRAIPMYADGKQQRDWVHVSDTCKAIEIVMEKGEPGGIYNIGAGNHVENKVLMQKICDLMGASHALIHSVADRPAHDFRYAVNWDKIKALGWKPEKDFDQGLKESVEWFRVNQDYWDSR